MTHARPTPSRETLAAIGKVRNRDQFRQCLGTIAAETGASRHLLLLERHVRGASQPLVVASNWIFDTVQPIGPDALERFAHSLAAHDATTGHRRADIRGADEAAAASKLRNVLRQHGHAEIHALPLRDAWRRCHLFLSSDVPGAIDTAKFSPARLACCYLLAQPPAGLLQDATAQALSDRERECLHWVAEGKTAGEVAMIVGVTANTVNSYLNHAIRKIGANNRAMAIATAIRTGVI